jgi:hypothetical protein
MIFFDSLLKFYYGKFELYMESYKAQVFQYVQLYICWKLGATSVKFSLLNQH